MILYLSIIIVSGVIISLLNCLVGNYGFPAWQIILWVVIAIVISFGIDAIIALICRKISYKHYNENSAFFREKRGERNFYEKLNIKAWKDKIPELGGKLKYFDKSKLAEKPNSDYFMTFIKESCMGEMMHFVIVVCAPLILLCVPPMFILGIGLPVMLVNMLLQIPSIFILRYTRPKLLVAYKRTKMVEEREKNRENLSNDNLEQENPQNNENGQ